MENPAMKEFRLKWTENASKGTKKGFRIIFAQRQLVCLYAE